MKRENISTRTETLHGQMNMQVASCSCIYQLFTHCYAHCICTSVLWSLGLVFHLYRTMIRAQTWRSRSQGRTQPTEAGSGTARTVAPPRPLCSLAGCQARVCSIEQLVPVGTQPKQQGVSLLHLHFFTEVAGSFLQSMARNSQT